MKDKKIYDKRYKKLKFKIDQPVLDIGGGDGSFLKWLGVKEAVIVDIDNFEINNGFDFVKADISKGLKLDDNFKTIFIMETLEHLKNPLYFMANVYDLLDEKGVCYVSIPYTELYPKWKSKNPHNIHYSRWTKEEIVEDMKKLGFKIKVIQQRRRMKNLAVWAPHCWIVLELRK